MFDSKLPAARVRVLVFLTFPPPLAHLARLACTAPSTLSAPSARGGSPCGLRRSRPATDKENEVARRPKRVGLAWVAGDASSSAAAGDSDGGPNAGAPAPGAGPVLTPVVKTGSSSGFSLSSVQAVGCHQTLRDCRLTLRLKHLDELLINQPEP